MPLATKRVVTIEYVEWTGDNPDEIWELCGGYAYVDRMDGQLIIDTLEGELTASVGDMIIKGVKGEFYPCKPDIFDETYDVLPTRWDRL